ncbi:hypothetical protein [Nodosilinea sp. LEGE 07298]|jgi:hypothetical protein|uniref:hypothetical protein n=1 Tax=Nodosilinea sp. LEGE 07298 TaxID=2777970 RepID=UPI001D150940|nr:hypothetical protein [Nodosilinea sp. LEGE 07298]
MLITDSTYRKPKQLNLLWGAKNISVLQHLISLQKEPVYFGATHSPKPANHRLYT